MAMITRHSPDAVRRAYAGRDALCRLFRLFPNMPEDRVKLVMGKIRECNEIIATSPDHEPWEVSEAVEDAIRTIAQRVDWYYRNRQPQLTKRRSEPHGGSDEHDRRCSG